MSNKTYTNPWAGLSSYQDPESADVQLKFCGRDNESFDVAQLIDDNIFVTLYGKSGTGKTSLLNAGVFPRLRQEQYLPVSIRLGMDAYNISFQQCILTKIAQALQGKGTQTTINVVPMPDDEQATEYLWSYFARTRFIATDGSTLFPVLVFDQFEEVFRNRRAEAETLLRQIHFMMDENHALSDRIINGNPYQYDFNFRFVASIREDDLYRLEDSIDNCYLPELKRCRYRLRSLSEQGARDVILIPGEGLFKAEEQKDIVEKIISKSRNEDGSISTNIISLLCSRIFTYHSSLSISEAFISPTLVDSFLKGNPFEQFYNEATRGFSNREKSYIEEHLVDSTGRRNSIPESDFLLHVKNGTVLLDGERKILQRTSTSSDGGNYRVELIHDSFCEPLEGLRQTRLQRKRIRVMLGAILLFVCVIGVAWMYVKRIEKANEQERENKALIAVGNSQLYLNQGNSYRALMELLDILPESADLGCSPSIEFALRAATRSNTTVIMGHTAAVNRARFNSDGTLIASASYDHTIKLWNVRTGECIKTFNGHGDFVYDVDFFSNDKRLISFSRDGIVKVWDIESNNCIRDLTDKEDYCGGFYLSPDKKRIILLSKKAQMYSSDTFECIKTFEGLDNCGEVVWHPNGKWFYAYTVKRQLDRVNIQTGKVHILTQEQGDEPLIHLAISPDGHKIAGAFGSRSDFGFVKIWDSEKGNCLQILKDKDDWTNGVAFSPDGKTLVSTSMNGEVRLWDAERGICQDILKGHSFGSCSPCFSPDGNFLMTTYADNTLQLWDLRPKNKTDDLDVKSFTYSALFNKTGDKVSSKKRIYTLPPCPVRLGNATYSNEEELVAASYSNDSLYLWNHVGKKWQRKLKEEKINIKELALSRNSNTLACFTIDSALQIWDYTTEKLIKNVGKQLYDCRGMNYSKDGTLLVQECSDSTIRIWNTKKWECIQSIKTKNESRIIAQITYDNKYLITSKHKNAFLWDIKTGKCLRNFEGHTSTIYGFSVSNDGKYLATTSHDAYVKVWDIASGICIQSSVYGQFRTIVFNPIVDKLCAVGYSVSFIDFPPLQQLIDETRERFKDRPLTKEERRKYYLE